MVEQLLKIFSRMEWILHYFYQSHEFQKYTRYQPKDFEYASHCGLTFQSTGSFYWPLQCFQVFFIRWIGISSVRPWKYENRDNFAPSQWNRNLKNVFSRTFCYRMTFHSVTLYGIRMYTRIDVFVYSRIVFLGIWSCHPM